MKAFTNYLLLFFFLLAGHFSYAQTKSEGLRKFSSYHLFNSSYEVKTIQLSNGLHLQYVEQGDISGTPVILLHGITDSWHSFEGILPFLPQHVHVFAISQRGHGNSDRPAAGYNPTDFADDIADFIKQKNISAAIIVGHSMGGVIVQQFALRYPALTSGIVIVSSAPGFKNNPVVPQFYDDVMKLKEIDRSFMEEFQQSTILKPIDAAYFNTLVDESTKVPIHVFKAALKELVDIDYTAKINQIQLPALILWGDKDGFCLRADQQILASKIKNSTFIEYKDTGHALHWEEPGKFSDDLLAFIARVNNNNPSSVK